MDHARTVTSVLLLKTDKDVAVLDDHGHGAILYNAPTETPNVAAIDASLI